VNTNSTERRLTTILAADIVGYSKLVGQDEAGTVAAVKALNAGLIEPKCSQYNGRIVKYMGDGVLMEFSSIVDAVIFAVEMQGAIADQNLHRNADTQIIYRIGINIGEIIVDGNDIQGNGINIAARIESIADPGGVFLSDAAYAQVIGKVDIDFEQRGEFEVKNIADPVSVWSIIMDEKTRNYLTPIENITSNNSLKTGVAVAAVVLTIIAAGGWYWYSGQDSVDQAIDAPAILNLPTQPSIAVLPFKTIGEDNNETYFSEGLTNDLVTGLSKFSGLFVSSRNSASDFIHETANLAAVARKLGVRYILQGSVQRADQRVRVNATLVEAGTSENLWAQKYDRDITDIFAVQDEIVGEIISQMKVSVDENERKRSLSKPPASMQAYDFYLRGKELDSKGTRSDNFAGQDMYKRAIELDPEFALAYTGLGWAVLDETRNGWTHDPAKGLRRVHHLAQAALKIESHAQGHALLGVTYLLMKHFDLARENLDVAIELNTNDAISYAALGEVSLWTDQLEQAETAFLKSMRLDPKTSPSVLTHLGTTFVLMGRAKEALPLLEKSIIRDPNDLFTQLMLVVSYSLLGLDDKAKLSAEKVWEIHPFFKAAPYRAAFSNPEHGELIARNLSRFGLN
jgi:adenylate cyclase